MRKIRNHLLTIVLILLILLCAACQPADVQGFTDGETQETEPESQLATYDYRIEELDVTLAIPESLYVYQIDGIYLDWTGAVNTHSFSKWMVVTDKEYDEAVLAQLLCENGRGEAAHIVFVVSVTPEAFFPARRLCYGLFSEIEVRVKGDQYCEVLDTGKIVKTAGRLGDYSTMELAENTDQWNEWIDQWTKGIEEKTESTPHLYGALDMVLRPNSLEVGDINLYAMTLANETFWEVYKEAVAQLQASSESYGYNEMEILTLISENEKKAEDVQAHSEFYQSEKPVLVYTDSREDVYIRAYYYAKYVIGRELSEGALTDTGALEDFVVILQDWGKGQRSFVVYRKAEDGNYLRYGSGYDYFDDLRKSYDYVQEYGVWKYYIHELDVTLTIPAGLYAYRINGVYQDWTDELNVHDFNQWIVVTDREFDASTLAYELRDNYEELAKHVIWGVSLVSKELWPVQQMCQGLFSHQDYRITDAVYCQFLYTENTNIRGGWLDSGRSRIIDNAAVRQRENLWGAWRDEWKEKICEKTLAAPYVLGYGVPLYGNSYPNEDVYDDTIVNKDMWEIYCKAAEELMVNADKYQYDETEVEPFVAKVDAAANELRNNSYSLFSSENPGRAYTDATQDVQLRAYAYAHCVVRNGKTGSDPIDESLLANIIVVRLDWEKGQKSQVTYVNPESGYYIKFSGYDNSVDLTEAYQYVTNH